MLRNLRFLVLCLLLIATPSADADEVQLAHWQFRLSFPKEARAEPFTGRVVLYFSRNRPEPRERLNWFKDRKSVV